MAYEKQIEDFTEARATWVSYTDIPLTNSAQLVRSFKSPDGPDEAESAAYLNAFISAKNVTASSTILDPQADGSGTLPGGGLKNVYPGIWRHVSTVWSRELQLFIQTLRRGWASTLEMDECMVKTGEDTREDARAYNFYWRNIASTAVDACVSALRAVPTLEDPLVQGETKAGVFAISEIVPMQQEDGSYWVIVKTTKVAEIASIADFATLVPVRKDIHDIENPFGLEGRYVEDTDTGRKPTDGVLLTYRALSKGSQAVLLALTDAELLGLLPGAGAYRFIKRELTEEAGNTLSMSLVYQFIPLALEITEESARYVGMERKNQSGKIIVEISWPRIDPDAMQAIQSDPLFIRDTIMGGFTVEGTTFAGDFFVNTTVAPMTGNEGVRIVQKMTKAGDQKLDIIVGKDPDHRVYEFWRWDISKLDIDEFMAQTGAERYALTHGEPANWLWDQPEVGTLKNVSINKKEDDSFDLHAIYSDTRGWEKIEFSPGVTFGTVTGVPLTCQDVAVKSSETSYGWNVPVALLRTCAAYYGKEVTPTVNRRCSFKISRQTEHVFDFQGERETFVTLISDPVVAEDDEFHTVEVFAGAYVLEADLDNPLTFGRPAVAAPNEKYEQQFKKNELGSYDGATVKTTFYPQDVSTVIEDTHERTVTRREGRYLLAATVASGFVQPAVVVHGTTVELSPVKDTGFDSFDVIKVTTFAKNQTNVTYDNDYSKALTKTENTAAVSPLGTPEPVVGHSKAVVNKERPDGKTTTVAIDEEELDQPAAGGEASLLEEVTVDAHTSGVTVPVPGASQNVKVDVVEAPTKGGRLQTKKVTSTLKPWTGSTAVVSDDGVTKLSQTNYKNLTAPPTAGANEEVQLSDNDRGGYNAIKRTKALAAGAAGTKAMHSSSIVDWDIRPQDVRTPVWSTTTNGDDGAYILGYNNWLVSMSRSRTRTTTITKSYTLTEPSTLVATPAVPGESEGSGTSYKKEARKNGDVWELTDQTDTTSAWGPWGRKTLTWINYIQQMTGSGS